MRRFHLRKQDPVDTALRAGRPEPRDEWVDDWSARVAPRGDVDARRWSRAAFAGALTVFMLGTFASFGGMSYAASSAKGTVDAVQHVVAPANKASHQSVAVRTSKSAAADQYGEQETVKPSEPKAPSKPKPAPATKPAPTTQVAGAAAGTPPTSGTLPFTGFGLGLTAAIGSLLLAFGIYLRRHESRS